MKFLQYFKQASETVSKETNAPLPSAVVIFNLLLEKIESINFKLQEKIDKSKNSDSSEYINKKLLLSFQAGLDKLAKHYQRCNWVYTMCLILDPRHKIKGFDETSWGKELKKQSVAMFEKMYKQEYFEKFSNEINLREESNDDSDEDDYLNLKSVYRVDSCVNAIESWKKEIKLYTDTGRASSDVKLLKWRKKMPTYIRLITNG